MKNKTVFARRRILDLVPDDLTVIGDIMRRETLESVTEYKALKADKGLQNALESMELTNKLLFKSFGLEIEFTIRDLK